MYFAHGHYVKIDQLSTTPVVSPEKAKESFAKHNNIPLDSVSGFISDLIIKEISYLQEKDTSATPKLVYKIYLFSNHKNNTKIGYIDAETGALLLTEPSLLDYSATGTFATRYNDSRQETTQNYAGAFHLADSTRGAIIHTWNLNGNTNLVNRIELSDNNNNWTSAEHSASENDMALDVQWALQKIYDHLNNSYGYNSFNDNGFGIDANIHYGSTSDLKDNAFWDPTLNVLYFGDGDVLFRPVACLDAVAHEYGHGITDFQIGWGATGDPRAFNEGLSDIWGAIMEYRINPSSVWKIGEQIDLSYGCLRNIQYTNDINARTKIADTYLTAQYNNGDPYVRSGVFSHWFYLLVNGGAGTNGIGNAYKVTGIGINEAEDLIIEAVFNNYLDNLTTYPAIRTAMVNAARTLCSEQNGALVNQVESAWYAVGVGSQPTISSVTGPTLLCSSPNSTFSLSNRPSGTSLYWTKSTNLEYVSGQGTNNYTVRASASAGGAGWIKATIHYSCDSLSVQYSVWVGPPSVTVTGDATSDCTNTTHYFTATQTSYYANPTSFSWNLVPLNGNTVSPYGYQNSQCAITFYNPYSASGYTVQARATNSCGTGSYGSTSIYIHTCLTFLLSPNPASGTVTVTKQISGASQIESSAALSEDASTIYTIRIINYYGSLQYTTTRSGDSFTIPINTLKDGQYIVQFSNGKEVFNSQLIVKH